MGVMGMIAKAKGKFHQRRMDVLERRTDKIRAENIKQAEITERKQELREAQQIREDLRADRMKQVEKAPPSKLQNLGKGLAKHMKKQKAKGGGLRAIPSSGSSGLQVGGSGGGSGPFGGTRNLDVGGGSSGGFSFGPSPKPKPEKKREGTTITIRTR